ncbi:MAG: hypothetical protein ACKVZ6_15880 [Kineosporiaceae bacterium]
MEQVGWAAGVVAPVMLLAGFFAIDEGGAASVDEPALTLAREITERHGRVVVGSVVGMLGAALLMLFAAAVRVRLARAGGRGELLGLAAFGFGVVAVAGAFLHGSFRLANAAVADPALLSEAVRPLAIMNQQMAGVMFWGILGLVSVLSWAAFSERFLPRVLAVTGAGLVAATVALVATDHGGVGLALLPWLVVAALLLAVRDRTPTLDAATT